MDRGRILQNHWESALGWPRFDHWIDKTEIAGQSENLITLVCYHQDSYLAPRNFSEVLREFVDVAKSSGQPQNFCIKIKEIADKRALIVACPKLLFSGIEITARRSLSVIIEKSRVVIGYNTTGILEAYLSYACIVVPWWKDAVRPADECLITKLSDFDQKTTYFPGSPADLRSMIEKALKNELPQLGTSHDRIRQFQRFVKYDPKVSASSRFEKFVRSYLPDKSP